MEVAVPVDTPSRLDYPRLDYPRLVVCVTNLFCVRLQSGFMDSQFVAK